MLWFFATTCTWVCSSSVQEMKSQACAACVLVAPMPSTSPPTKEDEPPVRPGIGATPTCRSGPSLRVCSAVEPSACRPIFPSVNACVQVGPASFLTALGTRPSPYSRRYRVYTLAATSLSTVDAVPCSLSTVPPEAQIIGQVVNSMQPG